MCDNCDIFEAKSFFVCFRILTNIGMLNWTVNKLEQVVDLSNTLNVIKYDLLDSDVENKWIKDEMKRYFDVLGHPHLL